MLTTDQDFLDVLVTAAEGGSNYWIKEAECDRDKDLNYTRITVTKTYEDSGHTLPVTVDVPTMRDTYSKILNGEKGYTEGEDGIPWFFGQIRGARDAGDIDATIADAFFQMAAFGEAVFG